ncbi:unnamed protein product [Cyprideis torosa]|uniref:ATP synthase subunit b n=1 Tax=Cyprideis torosa TaxID=163714 RepID=A0A7R8WKL9_9CRUS|nr:unnamed protein product [Cyprideis torosa]CAG0896267.1 unnamed protein product [Cyprideis torosa]
MLVSRLYRPEPIENVYEVGPNYPSKTPTPERDTENFPNVPLAKECPPVVMHFIPRSWFEFFYPKTGVSGGWVFLGGLVIFLLSKEIWVIEHSFYNGLSLLIIVWYGYTRFWPKAVEWGTEKQELEMIKIQYIYDKNVWDLRTQLEREERVRDEARAQTLLFEAKRENVALQLETCFRERQMLVYNEVKRRLDYQVEVQMSESRIKHQHMTNWIIAQVNQEITPELEAKVLQQCVADLRTIAVRFQE